MEPLVLENRYTGERLALRRVVRGEESWLEIRGSLPARSEGPPLHVHHAEDEEGEVQKGVLSAVVDGERIDVPAGGMVQLPRGKPHRWWNEGDGPLEFEAWAKPVVDLDRYLQAVFEVVNASPANRPSPIYMAHVMRRHRKTQLPLVMPRPIQTVVMSIAYVLGQMLGRYRGDDWPGCPSRCTGAPTLSAEDI